MNILKMKGLISKKGLWIVVIAAVIILMAVSMVTDRKPEEQIPEDISYGDECAEDRDCRYSFKTCESGLETSCENGCVYGVCTSCVPVCPGDSVCGNMTCMDSIKFCPDGKRIRCANYCDSYTGECTSCVPECGIMVKENINYEVKAGKFILDALPCVDANYTERKEVKIIKKDLSQIKLPEDYSNVINPFSLNRNGSFNLTISIPEIYTDVKVLRCRGKECDPVVTEYVKELRCGGKISKEFLRDMDYLEPKLMPIVITETTLNLASGQEIKSDEYNVMLLGDFENLGVTLSMPKENVVKARNPSLEITGTPLVIKVVGDVKERIDAIVTMPYISMEGFEEDSVGMYVEIYGGWEYIGGEINKDDKEVTATIIDINKYLDEDNEVKVALMEILCISCYGSSLTKAYEAGDGSETAIILVHGFDPEADTYREIIDDIMLTNQPFDVWTFDYPSSRSIKENMGELMDLLEKNHAEYEDIYIVGHSLGGMVVQQALHNSYLENKKSLENNEPFRYNYLDKVRKVILAGAGNEGSPVIEVYRNLFKNSVNNEKGILFNLRGKVVDDLVNGVITPRVPGISYNVIAGTKTYEFNLLFFTLTTGGLADIYEKNDGIITVKSAQHIGDGYIDNQCEDYWEVNLTHTELIDDPIPRKIIERAISEDISREGIGFLGRNKYFDISVEDGSTEDRYVVIGKKIREEKVLDKTGCSCGNGYCGEGENEINCPSDCAVFLSEEGLGFLSLLLVMLGGFVVYSLVVYRRYTLPHLKIMVNHIKTHYEIAPGIGYTYKQIRDAFLMKGWPKRVVNKSLKLLKKEFHSIYYKPLKKNIKEHLKKGYTIENIRSALVNHGWNIEWVEKVLRGEKLELGFKLKKEHKPKLKFEGEGKYFGLSRK